MLEKELLCPSSCPWRRAVRHSLFHHGNQIWLISLNMYHRRKPSSNNLERSRLEDGGNTIKSLWPLQLRAQGWHRLLNALKASNALARSSPVSSALKRHHCCSAGSFLWPLAWLGDSTARAFTVIHVLLIKLIKRKNMIVPVVCSHTYSFAFAFFAFKFMFAATIESLRRMALGKTAHTCSKLSFWLLKLNLSLWKWK